MNTKDKDNGTWITHGRTPQIYRTTNNFRIMLKYFEMPKMHVSTHPCTLIKPGHTQVRPGQITIQVSDADSVSTLSYKYLNTNTTIYDVNNILIHIDYI